MARALLISPSYFFFFFFFFFFILSSTTMSVVGGGGEEEENMSYVRRINPKRLKMRKEKATHIRIYWHDVLSGSNPTSVQIVKPANNSSTFFGFVSMMDNPLTVGPKLSSKLVGRAQGFYASADQREIGLLMVMNFVFVQGKYNGSTFTVVGRNNVFSKVREMEVTGGSGLFRFARGYVQAKTHMFNSTTGDASVEYNAFVLHY